MPGLHRRLAPLVGGAGEPAFGCGSLAGDGIQRILARLVRCCGRAEVEACAAGIRDRRSAVTREAAGVCCRSAACRLPWLVGRDGGSRRRRTSQPSEKPVGGSGRRPGAHAGTMFAPAREVAAPNAKVQPHAAPTQLSAAPHPSAACRLQRHVRRSCWAPTAYATVKVPPATPARRCDARPRARCAARVLRFTAGRSLCSTACGGTAGRSAACRLRFGAGCSVVLASGSSAGVCSAARRQRPNAAEPSCESPAVVPQERSDDPAMRAITPRTPRPVPTLVNTTIHERRTATMFPGI
jgi:hypothetical protein